MTDKPKVEIYTWDNCPFCKKAVALLDTKGVKYIRYRIDDNEPEREKMAVRANGKRTVPQIFIDDKHIGGCDDIHALEEKGELDKLLN